MAKNVKSTVKLNMPVVRRLGIVQPFNFLVACIVAIWLICNEIISILENINDIGVTLPPFLQPIVRTLKTQVEKKAVINESEDK